VDHVFRAVVLLSMCAACEREQRRFVEPAPWSSPAEPVRAERTLHPAWPDPNPEVKRSLVFSPYDENAWGVSEGKRLFVWFNCSGCHFQGGGGSGPALMDARWRYGSEPANVFNSIVGGRPNGMPAFRGKIPEQQVWQLVAYVRSVAGLVRLDVAPGRSDSLSGRPPEAMLRHRGAPAPQPESVPQL